MSKLIIPAIPVRIRCFSHEIETAYAMVSKPLRVSHNAMRYPIAIVATYGEMIARSPMRILTRPDPKSIIFGVPLSADKATPAVRIPNIKKITPTIRTRKSKTAVGAVTDTKPNNRTTMLKMIARIFSESICKIKCRYSIKNIGSILKSYLTCFVYSI